MKKMTKAHKIAMILSIIGIFATTGLVLWAHLHGNVACDGLCPGGAIDGLEWLTSSYVPYIFLASHILVSLFARSGSLIKKYTVWFWKGVSIVSILSIIFGIRTIANNPDISTYHVVCITHCLLFTCIIYFSREKGKRIKK